MTSLRRAGIQDRIAWRREFQSGKDDGTTSDGEASAHFKNSWRISLNTAGDEEVQGH